MTSLLHYLKENIDNFNILDFFKYFNLTSEEDCRKEFKRLVVYATLTKKECRYESLRRFAAEYEEDNFKILDTEACTSYYRDMRIQEIRNMYQGSAWNRERVAAVESLNVSNELLENKTAETVKRNIEDSRIESSKKQKTVLNESSCLPSSPPSKVLFSDLSFESLDSGSTFNLLDSDNTLSTEELDEANKEAMYIWERTFDEFGDDLVLKVHHLMNNQLG